MELDTSILSDLKKHKMPYGKYSGLFIYEIPTFYLEWYFKKGFPKGRLGMLLATMYEIKINGLESILNDI